MLGADVLPENSDPLVKSNTAVTGVLAQAEAMLHIDNLGLPAPLKRDRAWRASPERRGAS